MGSNESSATGVLVERLQGDMDLTYALMADATGALFWIAVIATVVVGYFWLSNLIEHLEIKKGWRHAVIFFGLILLAKMLNAAGVYLRELSPSYEPGEAVFRATWILLSFILLIGPFTFILCSRKDKKSREKGKP